MDEKELCPYCRGGILTTVKTLDPEMNYPKYCSNERCVINQPKVTVAGCQPPVF